MEKKGKEMKDMKMGWNNSREWNGEEKEDSVTEWKSKDKERQLLN